MDLDFAAVLTDGPEKDEIVNAEYLRPPEVLAPGPVLSLDAVRPQFAKYIAEVDKMVADAQAIEIKDEDSQKFAVALGGQAAKIAKAIDAKRKDVTAEASEYVKSVNGFCKLFTEKLDSTVKTVKSKIGQYQSRIQLERREAQRKADDAAKKLQEDLDKEAKEKGVEPVQVAAPIVPKEETVVRTETGSTAHFRVTWKAEVLDESLVPRSFCSPDMRKINDAVKMGTRTMPGVRIWEDKQPVLRS